MKGGTELPGFVNDYLAGKLEIDTYVAHRFSLQKINDAFEAIHSGDWYVVTYSYINIRSVRPVYSCIKLAI